MAERVPARLTPAQGRKFAFPVGIAFLVLAAVSWWRGHQAPPVVLAAVGAALLLAGVLLPASLGPVQRAWMGLAHAISRVTTPVFLGVVYFVVLTPIGMVMRLLGKNPMKHGTPGGSNWVGAPSGGRSSLDRQF